MSNRQSLLTALRAIKATEATVQYSGSDDEGFIDEIETDVEIDGSLYDELSNFFWDEVIGSTQYDGFHNGEGGFGTITWDIATDKIKMNHHAYVRDSISYPEETM
jgi:hypothetical protein